jgi:hypothetical protein
MVWGGGGFSTGGMGPRDPRAEALQERADRYRDAQGRSFFARNLGLIVSLVVVAFIVAGVVMRLLVV